MRRVFRTLSLTLLLGAALFQAGQAWQSASAARATQQVDENFVAWWEQRLATLRADIPAEVTYLGYVAEWDLPNSEWDAIDQTTEYVLTQYTFAPRIIRRGFVSQWVIGNFGTSDYRTWLDQHLQHYQVDEYGFGIVLIRTSGAQP